MVNHARTLLLNEEGPRNAASLVEAFIPRYKPVQLSGGLQSAYSLLFGSAPDYAGKVKRVARYMSVLHATEFSRFVTDLDARTTYTPQGLAIADYTTETWSLTPDTDAMLVKHSEADPITGRDTYVWTVNATGVNTVDVVCDNASSSHTLTFANGHSNDIPLRWTATTLRFLGSSLTPGANWIVRHTGADNANLGTILASLKSADSAVVSAVFANGATEPYGTFYRMYKDSDVLPISLSGFILGFVYRMEQLRVCQS